MTTEAIQSPLIATDAAKLRTLADWFDLKDDREGFTGEREVQADLRRIARSVDREHGMVRVHLRDLCDFCARESS